jgi:Ca2+-binding RTX toxin-like protein
MLTCRRAPSHRRLAIALVLTMALSNGGVSIFGPVVHAQAPVGAGFTLNAGDLRFIFRQIQIAQAHSAGGELFGPGPNQVNDARLPFGLRTVDGRFNHLDTGRTTFGASDQLFPRMTTPQFRPAETLPIDPDGPGGQSAGDSTSYTQLQGFVSDRQPRVISNLIVDQTVSNPAAVEVAGPGAVADPLGTLPIGNVAPDAGLSAPFNSMFTFFGQFFDHGLDLVNKGGNGTVFVPLQPDDPLFVPGGPNFMMLTRATVNAQHEAINQTTPFVDQNQTYTSHPSHQAFLREYALVGGIARATGRLIDGPGGNIGNWSEVKAQAAAMLGITLVDADVNDVPLLVTDPYGHLIRNAEGRPMAMLAGGGTVVLNPATPIASSQLAKTNHQFLNDIAHHAAPGPGKAPDSDNIASEVINGVVTPPQEPNTYDDETLGIHFITGDGRGNENIALTAVHQVFHAEHNRLQNNIHTLIHTPAFGLSAAEVTAWETTDAASGWDYGERLFQASRFVTEMQYQHLVFEEFARKLAPGINAFVGDGINFVPNLNPAIFAEFAHQTYRLGHSMLTETIARTAPDGTTYDIPLLDGFLNPAEYNRGPGGIPISGTDAAGAIFQGGTAQVGAEIDEFVTEAVRNRLVGLPLDLAVLNIARGRSEGVAPLNVVRQQLFDASGDFVMLPYLDWFDFSFAIRHPESLVNFIAAYGQHATLTDPPAPNPPLTMTQRREAAAALVADPDFMFQSAATSGVNDIDLWMGGLAEKPQPFGGMLGSTFNFVFEAQLEALQNADRFYYLERLDGLNLLAGLEANSFVELIARNTTLRGAAADVFSNPGLTFNMSAQNLTGPIVDDPATEYDERGLLTRMPNGTIRYAGPEHVVFNGRNDAGDRMFSSEGDDTMRGDGGNDVMEGGAGNDQHIGGAGDDILTDVFGEDVMKGGPGNDAISGGSGPFDLLQGNDGNDFIVGGNDESEVFGGQGDDIIYMGAGLSESIGGSGNDWMEGTVAPASIAIGDDNDQFQNNPNGGHDILVAGPADMDFDAEGGDDIMVGNVAPTHRFEGMLGFDWVTYRGETQPVDADMLITGATEINAPLNENRDRFDNAEGLSGSSLNDLLRGDDRTAAELFDDGLTGVLNAHVLNAEGIARITGLAALLPAGATSWGEGNIILGGAGSDLIEGRGGNDIIDGDAWLNVQLQAPGRNPANSLHELKADVFAGLINPGSITMVRTITTQGATPQNVDIAVFTGPSSDYTIEIDGAFLIVTDNVGTDGVDRLRNIELLRFADGDLLSPVPTAGVTVPNVVNQLQATATTNLTNLGFTVTTTSANSTTIASGRVISQSIPGGQQAAAGSAIALVISLGPAQVAVPDVVGATLSGATTAINGAGLVLTTTNAVSDTVAAGNVISQTPVGGALANVGSNVALVISTGGNPAGLVAAFGFEETTGTVITDSSASPRNGTIANANGTGAAPTRVAAGKIGRAMRFDGGDNVSVTDILNSKLDLTNGMTLEAWVNPSTMNGWESVIYKERGGAGTGLLSYALYAHDGGTNTPPAGYVRTSVGGPDRGISAASRLPLNQWSHIAVTYNTAVGGSTLAIYVNGALVTTVAGPNQNLLAGNQPLRIGNSNAQISEGFNGMIDEVRVYNRALSAAEIQADMTKAVVFGTPVVP